MTTPNELQSVSATDVLQVVVNQLKNDNVECTINDQRDGNAVLKYEEFGSERGRSLRVFYWVISNPLPPRRVRVANFSYTILAEQRKKLQIQHDLELLEAEIEAATFSPKPGIVYE
jgi:hypothetical protein